MGLLAAQAIENLLQFSFLVVFLFLCQINRLDFYCSINISNAIIKCSVFILGYNKHYAKFTISVTIILELKCHADSVVSFKELAHKFIPHSNTKNDFGTACKQTLFKLFINSVLLMNPRILQCILNKPVNIWQVCI